jgi:alginate O-acetyltransferase complex protein AlgJ
MTVNDRPKQLPPVHEAWLPREHSLYRPRHSRRQRTALLCALVFFAAPALSYLFGLHPAQFENRALAAFPSIGRGWSFFTSLPQWGTDHLMFREQAVHAADGISRGLFGEPPPLSHPSEQVPLQAPQSAPTTPVAYSNVIEGGNGWLYLGEEVADHCQQAVPLPETVARLRRLRDTITASGRRFVVVVAPDKTTMAPQYLPDNFVGKSCLESMTARFWQAMDGEDYVLDLRSQLADWGNRLGAPVYGPQDAHWSDEGGIVMTRALAEKLRPGISSTWQVTPTSPWEVTADLPPLIGRSGTTSGTHYAIKPDGRHDQTRPTPSDFMTPVHLDTAKGPGTYGLNVGLLGDSFTIRTMPYLAAAFRDLTALHYSTAEQDHGAAAADLVASSNVVVLEVAERSLVRGGMAVLDSPGAMDTIVGRLGQ